MALVTTARALMIVCPATGELVWTGVTTSEEVLGFLDESETFRAKCSACGEIHEWTRSDAQLGDAP
ncbi:MAG TPA: hypothetical protein VGG41_08025 [Solirubrobacteraceae bacterium]